MNALEPVKIEKLVYGGEGLGRLSSGEVVFVPFSAAGDCGEVEVQPIPKKPKKAVWKSLTSPSASRVEPPCSLFGQCGGCQWQHLEIATQREWKQAIVAESLTRLGKLPPFPISRCLGEDEPQAWHYRNRVQWVTEKTAEGWKLGYHPVASHAVLAFDHCWIISPQMNAMAQWLQSHLPLALSIEKIQVQQNDVGECLVTFSGEDPPHPSLLPWLDAFQEAFPSLKGVVWADGKEATCLWGQPFLTETLGALSYQVSAESFFQVNRGATLKMLTFLEEALPKGSWERMLDLYAGVGLFSRWFQGQASEIIAVEQSLAAVADGQASLQPSVGGTIAYYPGKVETVLAQLEGDFDIAFVDPPRAGCSKEALDWLSEHVTGTLVYISCNPTTLARDLAQWVRQGWQIQCVQPVDMFPQTYHVETVVILRR